MKRREFIVGMAGVVAARNTPAAVCFGSPVPIKPMTIPHDRWHSGIVSFDEFKAVHDKMMAAHSGH